MRQSPADRGCLDISQHEKVVNAMNTLRQFANPGNVRVEHDAATDTLEAVLWIDESPLRRIGGRERFRLSFEIFVDNDGLYRRAYGTHVAARSDKDIRPLMRNCGLDWFEHMIVMHLSGLNADVRRGNRSRDVEDVTRALASLPFG